MAPVAVNLFVVLLVLLGVLVVIGAAVYAAAQARKRRDAFRLTAAQRGWHYAERDDRWTTRFQGAPFGDGRDRRASNVVTGVHDGRAFVAFDYHYETTEHYTDAQGHSRTRTVNHDYSVIGLELGVRYPNLAVTPEGFFTRAVGRLLNRDIELESEEFNRAFTVTCTDRKFATDVLHPQMMEYLLALPRTGFSLRDGSAMMVRDGHHSLAEIDDKLRALDGIGDRIPEFVREAWRGPVPPAGSSAMPPPATPQQVPPPPPGPTA